MRWQSLCEEHGWLGVSGNKMRGQEKTRLNWPGHGRDSNATQGIWPIRETRREASPRVINGLWSVSVIHSMCWSLNNVPCDTSALAYATRFKECCYLLSDHKTKGTRILWG